MVTTKCIECGTETYQKDGICALCGAGITQMRDDLFVLLDIEKTWSPPRRSRTTKRTKKPVIRLHYFLKRNKRRR
ncbi:MAG: hypothetical protein FJ243_00905 [Nitrospira sp.]|nr:hypothetical protein [Nitrospira sp.]